MLIYEVNVTLAVSDSPQYRIWLQGHVEQILEINGFSHATISKRSLAENQSAGKQIEWVIQYFVKTKEDLDHYLEKHAPRFRADAEKSFGGKFKAQRRILDVDTEVPPANETSP